MQLAQDYAANKQQQNQDLNAGRCLMTAADWLFLQYLYSSVKGKEHKEAIAFVGGSTSWII